MLLLEKITNTISENQLFLKDDFILCAVSGGIDSMVMLDCIRKLGYNIGVAHLNYKLRGVENDIEKVIVENYCIEHRIRFHYLEFDLEKNKTPQFSTQMLAREVRYNWFYELFKS